MRIPIKIIFHFLYTHTHAHKHIHTCTFSTQKHVYCMHATHIQLTDRAEPILLFFSLIFLSSNSFLLTYFAYFCTHKRFFLVYLQLFSMHDCCIRVIHNMVTALLEYLDLLAVFPEAYYVDLILFVTILVEYLHLCNAKYSVG